MTEEPDWDDPQVQDQWCAEVRGHVEAYLRDEQVEHGRIAEEPTWFVAPYVALWAVESKARPETVGAWVISGDVPMDLAAAEEHEHPRDAMHAIGDRWLRYAEDVRAGRANDAIVIEGVEDDQELVSMLADEVASPASLQADGAAALWKEAMTEDTPADTGESGVRAAYARFARRVAKQVEFDALVIPALVTRPAMIEGHQAHWDGVWRLVETPRIDLQNVHTHGGRGAVQAASLHVAVLTPEGEVLFEGVGGLTVLQRLELHQQDGRTEVRVSDRETPFADATAIREGVRTAFQHAVPAAPAP